MRGLALLLAAAAVVGGIYYGYLRNMPASDPGAAPTQVISLTGVQSDLLQIAQAERAYVAANGSCVPFGELASSSAMALPRTERDGYTYTVECEGALFTVIARHAAAAPGSTIRYPSLAVDQSMSFRESE